MTVALPRFGMCAVRFRQDGAPGKPAFMPFDRFRALLDGFEGVDELHLQGLGVPLLHPRFFASAAVYEAVRLDAHFGTLLRNLRRVTAARSAAVWSSSACQAVRDRLASPGPPGICAGCAVYRGRF